MINEQVTDKLSRITEFLELKKERVTEKVFETIKTFSCNKLITINSKLEDCNLSPFDEIEIKELIYDLIDIEDSYILDTTKTIKENIDVVFNIYVRYILYGIK